jgi:hypothetical protein
MGTPDGAVSLKPTPRSIQDETQARTREAIFVSHGNLLRLALRRHCHGIHSEPILRLCRPEKNFWVFKATAYKSSYSRGFVGYGDAHPSNVTPLIFNHAEMRMAEPRAHRTVYGVALCSLEGRLPGPFRQSSCPYWAAPFSTDRRFRKEFCVLPPPFRHVLGE